jgi:tRNA nucleotidyltransferase (CCA-adding enzyme)
VTLADIEARSYLVGGAVRDGLLGLPIKDRDYVVVGVDAEAMLAAGFQSVGADFPVFLHPVTQAEYALARTERKTGKGYTGFAVRADAAVTLEDDLRRRDFTINAMAKDASGALIDPYGGSDDLRAGCLRHVSPAFAEDPVRILRGARFLARYPAFRLAPETLALMRSMVESGEVDHLVPERVWQELRRALTEPLPSAFLRTLDACHALRRVLPEIAASFEAATNELCELVDRCPTAAPGDDLIALAVLCHALDPPTVQRFAERLKLPGEHRDVARLVAAQHLTIARYLDLDAERRLALFESLDAWRRPDRARRIAAVAALLAGNDPAPFGADLTRALAVATEPLLAAGFRGAALGARLREERLAALSAVSAANQALP